MDRGPNNSFTAATQSWAGIRTNQLPFGNSYWFWLAFFAEGQYLNALKAHQRSVDEVGHPSQKIIIDCWAINPKDKNQNLPNLGWTLPQQHGKARWPTLFVDGHASITWYPIYAPDGGVVGGIKPPGPGVWQIDPEGVQGWGIGSLNWIDVP